jgi:hypothetical protein
LILAHGTNLPVCFAKSTKNPNPSRPKGRGFQPIGF